MNVARKPLQKIQKKHFHFTKCSHVFCFTLDAIDKQNRKHELIFLLRILLLLHLLEYNQWKCGFELVFVYANDVFENLRDYDWLHSSPIRLMYTNHKNRIFIEVMFNASSFQFKHFANLWWFLISGLKNGFSWIELVDRSQQQFIFVEKTHHQETIQHSKFTGTKLNSD